MGIDRREFLGLMLAASQVADAQPSKDKQSLFYEDQRRGYSILQGLTDEESAQFTIVTPATHDLAFSVSVKSGSVEPTSPRREGQTSSRLEEDTSSPREEHTSSRRGEQTSPRLETPTISRLEKVTRPFSAHAVHRLQVSGLKLGSIYTLTIAGQGSRIMDQREFKALDLSPRAVKLGLISCALDHLSRDSVWTQLEAQKPDMVFFLGDNVYTDRNSLLFKSKPDEEQLWHRYVATRLRLAFYYQKQLIPVLAIWDDHDFGGDNMGSEYAHKEESMRIFETFFAQNERPCTQKGAGIARRFTAFGADFFLMDGRYFRENGQKLDRQMFGIEQENWLFQNIRSSATFVMNGSMFYGAYTGKDAFEGQFDSAFKRFVERTKKSSGLFCFASGDVHFSEVQDIEAQQLGYPTFELTSSSIHSSAFPGHQNRFKNARRRTATGSHNFIILEVEFSDTSIRGVATSYGANAVLFRVPVAALR